MALPTIYLKNINLHATQIKDDTANIITQLDTIISQGGGGGGGGSTGLSLESTQLEVLNGITSGFSQLHSDLTSQLTVNVVDVSELATKATQDTISTNISTTLPLFTFSPLGGAQNNALKTRVENFPTTQGITGSISVSNFPTTQDVNIQNTELTVNVISGFATETTLGSIDTKLGGELAVNVISGFATETTLGAIDTKLGDNISTGGFNVSLTSLNGDKITNTTNNSKIGLDTNIINTSLTVEGSVSIVDAVSVNVLETNSTVYDFTNDSSTMTQADDRFEIDRVRPDSWSFTNTKNQTGSNVFWYSNTVTSPLGAQQFPILHGDLQSLYFVAGINRTEDINAVPFMAVFSPSNIAFYTSRWIYTIDPSEKLIQGEKVLLYYGSDPVNIHTNIRHLQLLFNAVASQGSLLETEVCYLMSINTASGLTASSVYYNLYNAGWILNDVNKTHNDYEFNSGIKSKADLLLSRLNESSGNLGVNVANSLTVGGTSLDQMTFTTASGDGSIVGLNVITRNAFYPTTFIFTENDISITDETPSIDLRAYNKLSVFGTSTHTGGGSHNIIVQYSNDNITFYDSPNVIATTANKFAYDNSTFCVSYMRFRFQVELTDLTFIVSLK